jgi:MerR family regulatory protein
MLFVSPLVAGAGVAAGDPPCALTLWASQGRFRAWVSPRGRVHIEAMSSALLAIGDFSRATQLSVKMLRHYHQIGLLEHAEKPAN